MKNKIFHIHKTISLGLLLCAGLLSAPKIHAQPVITNQPVSVTTNTGATIVFQVWASGASGYRWYFSGSNSPVGANSAGPGSRLTLRNIQSGQAGNYYAVVTNSTTSVTSSIATLAFNAPTAPSITHQPVSMTTNAGAIASFSVTATGASPLSYQWWFSGTNVSISSSSLIYLFHVKTNQAGNYFVIITNTLGAATSSVATLTVNSIPATNYPAISIVRHSSIFGDVLKLLALDVGSSYRVQSSLDMSSWADFMTVFAYTSTIYCTNSEATNNQTFYYRVVSP